MIATYRAAALASMILLTGISGFAGRTAPDDPRPVVPAVSFAGPHSRITQRGFHFITDQPSMDALWKRHLGPAVKADAPEAAAPTVDFERFVVVAFFRGATVNTRGESVREIDDLKDELRVRFSADSYQTAVGLNENTKDAGIDHAESFGIWVLPRVAKPIVIEEDVRELLNEPAKWKEQARFAPK